MIISASRRTDIPAYYSEWFYNRIEDGFCTVPNPFNPKQISFVDLTPGEVTAIVFWTRNAYPLMKKMHLLDERGYKYYFQFTINNFPKNYEPFNPSYETASKCFKELSKKIGNGKIIWRYDPILFTDDLDLNFHIKNFTSICNDLTGYTKRVVISIVDDYKKTLRRLNKLDANYEENQLEKPEVEKLLKIIVETANKSGMEVESCAEAKNFGYLGIQHGRCVDDRILRDEFGIDLIYKKDKNQRLECGCTISKDIGMNDTCLMGCEYCYATTDHNKAVSNKKKHDPKFSSLLVYDLPEDIEEKICNFKLKEEIELFA